LSASELGVEVGELLIPLEMYLAAGVRIGTRMKSKFMEPYIYSVRPDGLYLLDVKKTDERIRIAAKFIARYPPEKVVVVAGRQYAHRPAKKFCGLVGCKVVTGRVPPGMFTNPALPHFTEASLLLITDPRLDEQALMEAGAMGIPVVALCDTDSPTSYVDLIIPTNNRGRKALALVFWLLAREVLRARGDLPPSGELPVPLSEFEARVLLTGEVV
jgi:small subunit ribosomal protein S2